MHISQVVTIGVAAFVIGVFLGSLISFEVVTVSFIIIAAISLIMVIVKPQWFLISAVCAVLMTGGMYRYHFSFKTATPDTIQNFIGQRVDFQAEVVSAPEVRVSGQRLILETQSVDSKSISGRVVINIGLYPRYRYGDIVAVTCQLKAPEAIEDFDYPLYLAKDDIYAICVRPSLRAIGYHDTPLSRLFAFREILLQTIRRDLPQPAAGIVGALVFNERGSISPELSTTFSVTGISHVIAISGSHFVVIIVVLERLLLLIGLYRRQAMVVTAMVLGIYVIIIGLPASALRAVVMAYAMFLALWSGRSSQSGRMLLFAAAVLLLWNPKLLIADVGFQLSFAAVAGIIYLVPLFSGLVQRWRESIVGELLLVSLAAQATTLPITIWHFGVISLISPVANLLIVPIASALLIMSIIALGAATIAPALATIVWFPVWVMVQYIIFVTHWLQPYAITI